ncbi:MAG TPA: transglutaminase family protein [Pirellulales bacterium]|jgi:uncharacterized protein (DUF2126 family)|nr:transglutaminase family protein [Pirellulales bacterium]
MGIRVAIHHRTSYRYDRFVNLGPQVVRLRPAPHCRTPILSYSLRIAPEKHFINWQQDPFGNFSARLVFLDPTRELTLEVDLVAELTVINPFDFFLEPEADEFPFAYNPESAAELQPYLRPLPLSEPMRQLLARVPLAKRRTIDFLVDLNRIVHEEVKYVIRLEPGVQTCDETLERGTGSCRDSAWLLVQVLRNLGLAARFVSGYLVQLKPDTKSLDGPSGAAEDFTDLHAWTEVYLPGAGWVGLDPTSGLFTGEGHLPLAATPEPGSASPITGGVDHCETQFNFHMSVTRIHEDPRVSKPYTEAQWSRIDALGQAVDQSLKANDVRLTIGGEPTFVSIDDMDGEEWNTGALGENKRRLAGDLFNRLAARFAHGPLLQYGQGKWYPGESLPRWALGCYWRTDGQPLWTHRELLATDEVASGHTEQDAERFIAALAKRLHVDAEHVQPAYEDVWYYLWKERRLPVNVDPLNSQLSNREERDRLAKVFEQGLSKVVGYALPLRPLEGHYGPPRWESGPWYFRGEHMYLLPGDSAMGFRLPLDSIPWMAKTEDFSQSEPDPFAPRAPLAPYRQPRAASHGRGDGSGHESGQGNADRNGTGPSKGADYSEGVRNGDWYHGNGSAPGAAHEPQRLRQLARLGAQQTEDAASESGVAVSEPEFEPAAAPQHEAAAQTDFRQAPSAPSVVRTAICVEARDGLLHIFLPPIPLLEDFLDLISQLEQTAVELSLPIRIEGYSPPTDARLKYFKITPDPGVIEVNLQPAAHWDELVENTNTLYDEARLARLGTEKFMLDGRHTGTGGGNHIVLGGPTPSDSPFLRRPDLLRSLATYWNNRPSLSYLFSGLFVGPSSQAPRVDEARHETVYELETAFTQLPAGAAPFPWVVDRVLRHLLVDMTGNTHRAEFCIDKLFSPDSSSGRLGLVEFRAFEMPPHARMSLTQQLLVRALVARFWQKPFQERLVQWGTALHDRFLLPHFVAQDFSEILTELSDLGFPFEQDWFASHFEFRFPRLGEIAQQGLEIELRQAIEPWHVLGEEPGPGGTARYVDSSVERLQVKVRGMTDTRHVVACNGRRVPLHSTGTPGEFVAGVRYRAWQPPSCLHPTIGIHTPLVFDIIDTWNERSIGGCTWHVAHPGGRGCETFPVNAYEAESRRVARFFKMNYTGGRQAAPPPEHNPQFPLTLDLRRPVSLATFDR